MDLPHIQIIETKKSDLQHIMEVEKLAFNSNDEAELVNNLLQDSTAKPVLSLLAFYESEAVGHILFTRATIEKHLDSPLIYILAPLAVIPKFQKQGIGGLLIREGIKRLKNMGVEKVFVLGHPEYYPKHGFVPNAESLGFPAPYYIPPKNADAWMVKSLHLHNKRERTGQIVCADAMNQPEYWRE